MNTSMRAFEAALRRSKLLPRDVLKPRTLDYAPYEKRDTRPDVFVTRARFLTRGGAVSSRTEFERLMGTNDLVDEFYLERTLLAPLRALADQVLVVIVHRLREHDPNQARYRAAETLLPGRPGGNVLELGGGAAVLER